MSNPYESPYGEKNPFGDQGQQPATPPPGSDLVSHVKVVAILMIVQGILEILLGLLYLVLAFVMPLIIQADPDFNDGPGEMPMVFMTIIYGAMGLGGFIPGLLHLIAGIRNLRYKGRTMGIVALGFGLAATMTCYCAPTSIALTVYGLIVYLNPAVAQVFAAQDQRQQPQDATY